MDNRYGIQPARATENQSPKHTGSTSKYGLGTSARHRVDSDIPSSASLAARGQQMNPYQPVNPQSRMNTYGNVQLPPTELGPNQSTAGVRDRIASVYDPQSWNNATYSPGQIREQVANRTERTLTGIRNAPDRTGARSQYQYSPLAPASAFQGLNDATAANREQQMARIRTVRASQDQSLANDPQAARRLAAMTGQANTAVNPNDYRGRMARATNQYNMYAASTRADGKTPMPFDDFLSQLAPNAMTPEVRNAITQSRWSREANRPSAPQGQPNMQASQFLASRYGVPMQIPQDPQQAAQWTQTLAMQGNPYAASLNQQAIQQGYATQQQAIDQAGQNYRAQLNNQPKQPVAMTPQEHQQMLAGAMSTHPEVVGREMQEREVKRLQDMGYSPDQIRASASVAQAYSRGYQMAEPQYRAASQFPGLSPYYPPITSGTSQSPTNYGLPLDTQGTAQPTPISTPVPPAYIPPNPPSLNKPDTLSFPEATPAEVALLLEQDPTMTPEMLEATLASGATPKRPPSDMSVLYSTNNTAPKQGGWLRAADPRDAQAAKRGEIASSWADRYRSRYGIRSLEEHRKAIEAARREIPREQSF